MARDFAKQLYNSSSWHKVRDLARTRDFNLCVQCGQPADVVHHVIPLDINNINDTDITLNIDNLICLCTNCHALIHSTITIEDVFDNDGYYMGKQEIKKYDNGYGYLSH